MTTTINQLARMFASMLFVACSATNAQHASTTTSNPVSKRDPVDPDVSKPWSAKLEADELRLTILGTNDIHGGLEASFGTDGNAPLGGMAMLGGIVDAIRAGLNAREGDRAAVIMVDAGDQYQGSLASNTNEGTAMMEAMNSIGYDAIVPGNHAYDFGPIGWKEDRSTDPAKRLEVIERAARISRAPFISANTFLKESIRFTDGRPVTKASDVKGVLCKPQDAMGHDSYTLDFAKARRPDYVKPYVIVDGPKGMRVALIGLDYPKTPTSTTAENVDGLCFAELFATYKYVHAEAMVDPAGPADMFVLVLHEGDSNTSSTITSLVTSLKDEESRMRKTQADFRMIDAVVSGHTHHTYAKTIAGVPVIQSGSGGKAFGRIDLIWDTKQKMVVAEKTKLAGGVLMQSNKCDPSLQEAVTSFCEETPQGIAYEGVVATPKREVTAIVQNARQQIPTFEPLAAETLGTIIDDLEINYAEASPLSNFLTDGLLNATRVHLAANGEEASPVIASFLNILGMRSTITKSSQDSAEEPFHFEQLFNVLPFSNRAVVLTVDRDTLLDILRESAKHCFFGAVMQSGLKVRFQRNCPALPQDADGIDQGIRLTSVTTVDGKVIFDAADPSRIDLPEPYSIVTFDFLADGGDGYVVFRRAQSKQTLGIVRDMLAEQFAKERPLLRKVMDERWRNDVPRGK